MTRSMAIPGLVVVWSGTGPCFDTHRIPPAGLTIGRSLVDFANDDRISRVHADIAIEGARVRVTDRGSRNGTFASGEPIVEPKWVEFPCIIRTGNTISILVAEIRPYEHVPISRRGTLVLGGSLDKAARAVDLAAIAADNLVLIGPRSCSVELARGYASSLGGTTVEYDPRLHCSLRSAIEEAKRLRTVILVLGQDRLSAADAGMIASLAETDVRFVTCVTQLSILGELTRQLATRVVELPSCRLDELPTTLADIVAVVAPNTSVHASAIEHVLLAATQLDEDRLLDRFRTLVTIWRKQSDATVLRGQDLENTVQSKPAHWCIFIEPDCHGAGA